MSLAAELKDLRGQRQREIALLCSRVAAVTSALEADHAPAGWVRQHPYVATAGAALIGFAAAQWPRRSASAPPPAVPISPPHSSSLADLLPVLASLAQRFLPSQSEPDENLAPATLAVAEIGCVSGPAFPPLIDAKP